MTPFILGLVIGGTMGSFTVALFAVGTIKYWQSRHAEALSESRRFEALLHGKQNN